MTFLSHLIFATSPLLAFIYFSVQIPFLLSPDCSCRWSLSHLVTLRDTPQSVGLLWTRDRPVVEAYTAHNPHKRHTSVPRRDSNPRSQQASRHKKLSLLYLLAFPYTFHLLAYEAHLITSLSVPRACSWQLAWPLCSKQSLCSAQNVFASLCASQRCTVGGEVQVQATPTLPRGSDHRYQ